MSNKEAYLYDLAELEQAIDDILRAVPVGKKKQEIAAREEAERIAEAAKATIACMRVDYIPVEL